MREVRERLRELAAVPWPVRIEGPTGSGKGLAARVLHDLSPWANGPFVRQSLTALAQGVEFGRLFGWSRGGFTGAARDAPGAAESAHGGTLFLDEVASASPYVQGGLLQLLEDGEVLRIGEQRPRKLDVRFVFATNADLDAAVAAGTFRRDLFHRLGSLVVRMPALRDHIEDLPELTRAIVARLAAEVGRSAREIPDTQLDQLRGYPWPGNVRELQHAMAHFLAFATLPPAIGDAPLKAASAPRAALAREALGRHGGNKSATARALGVSRMTIHRWLREEDGSTEPRVAAMPPGRATRGANGRRNSVTPPV